MAFKITWVSFFKILVVSLLIAAIVIACFTLPIDKMLKDFLEWIQQDVGPWGPVMLVVAYVPLTILAVPASILTLGGGYLFGLPLGLISDSLGSTIGAGAAFLLGRTLGRSMVMSKLKDYPQFCAVEVAVQRAGFKIVFLLRLVPLLPFNILNYLLSITSVPIAEYMLATWLGMMPITLALVYVGTTLKDLSDVTHGWHEISKTRWAFIVFSIVVSAALMIVVTRVAKAALEKALSENKALDCNNEPTLEPPNSVLILHQPLLVKIAASSDNQEKLV